MWPLQPKHSVYTYQFAIQSTQKQQNNCSIGRLSNRSGQYHCDHAEPICRLIRENQYPFVTVWKRRATSADRFKVNFATAHAPQGCTKRTSTGELDFDEPMLAIVYSM